MFRQQNSKIGNTREQLFHALRYFHFDENTKTLDAYVNHIRQVATLLGYQEPQMLEVFKNTLPTKLYWVFSHNELMTSGRNSKKNIDQRKDR